jgi:endonuclease-8
MLSACELEILDEAGLAFHPYLSKLGPDVLDLGTKPKDIVARLEDRRFMRRGLGALLLDQSFVAGLGNDLRSELFFEARLSPRQRPVDLAPAARRRLAKAILLMANRAYETKGVTLPKTSAAKLRRAGSSWSNARHWVFAREAEACRICEAPIERFDLSGRRVYCCSVCQPRQA